ncbi:hypothetical protein P7F60_06205 [Rhizobium sp. YJ-22]|uniref:hypothetical protein n=1 Tax=Rhizobium sp. YJ-22 TaxID=3037556 RepID=UPI00241279EE|nr:hypothetical protein [Rhizobium sp. YJ-22]MDG3575968.1 hypothetical protein [Rhizobium sp. YJ-22]
MTAAIYKIVNEAGDAVNQIVADEAFVEAAYPGRWELVGPMPEAPSPAPAYPALSRRQLLLGLLSIGVTEGDVEAEITAAVSDPMEREAALIEWRAAGSYERTHPLIADIATAMNLPAEQVDALWLWAAGL